MNKADRIFIGKTLFDLRDAIKLSHEKIRNTTEFEYALMDGLGVRDGRSEEVNSYKSKLNSLTRYVIERYNLSFDDLEGFIEEYKTVGFGEYFELKNQCNIKDELSKFI